MVSFSQTWPEEKQYFEILAEERTDHRLPTP